MSEKSITKTSIALLRPRWKAILQFRLLIFYRDEPFRVAHDLTLSSIRCEICDFQILCCWAIEHVGSVGVVPPLLNGRSVGKHFPDEGIWEAFVPDVTNFSSVGWGCEVELQVWLVAKGGL